MIALIKNPGAGSVEEDTETQLHKAFSDLGAEFELFEDDNPSSAADAAIAKGHTILCACGGDGTVAGVVNSMMRSGKDDLKLAIVPLGTGNLVATALGIPGEIEDAAKIAAENTSKRVDVGKIEKNYFLLGLGIGATEIFVTETSSALKEKLGRLAYVASLFKSTREPLFELEIESDSRRTVTKAEAVTLANYWGTRTVEMIEGTADDDGVMECLINHRLTLPTLLRLAIRGLMGKVRHDPDVDFLRGSRFVIRTTPALSVQLDGNETEIETPIEVQVLRQAIEVIVAE
ncbi:MAG: diacylglycerol kinase family protein [Fimbriimonadales bacterium]